MPRPDGALWHSIYALHPPATQASPVAARWIGSSCREAARAVHLQTDGIVVICIIAACKAQLKA